ncbi:hypothetical protein [Salinirarus marinus]
MTERLGRREVLVSVAGGSLASAGLIGGTTAAFIDGETASGTLATGTWGGDGARVAYTDGGTLYSLVQSGGTTAYGVTDVDVLGPVETGFGGSSYHVPLVDGGGTLRLVAADGTQTALDTSAARPPRGAKSVLATAAWNGHPLSVYYPGSNESKLFRVAPGGTAKQVSEPGNGVKAVLGAGDIDGDGTAEFVFVDGSGTIRYIVPSGENASRGIESTGTGPGSNNNYGAGRPSAVGGYGVVVPAVNGSGGLGLVGANGWVEKSLTAGSTASKTAVAPCDFDGDDAVELVFVGSSNAHLQFLDDVGGANDVGTIADSSGDPVPADTSRGVL